MKTISLKTEYSDLLKRSLGVYEKQHEAIARNVSNANNQDYERVRTDFSHLLQAAADKAGLRMTREGHIDAPNFHDGVRGKAGGEGGPVEYTREMTELAENQMRYDFAARALRGYFQGIINSITGKP